MVARGRPSLRAAVAGHGTLPPCHRLATCPLAAPHALPRLSCSPPFPCPFHSVWARSQACSAAAHQAAVDPQQPAPSSPSTSTAMLRRWLLRASSPGEPTAPAVSPSTHPSTAPSIHPSTHPSTHRTRPSRVLTCLRARSAGPRLGRGWSGQAARCGGQCGRHSARASAHRHAGLRSLHSRALRSRAPGLSAPACGPAASDTWSVCPVCCRVRGACW